MTLQIVESPSFYTRAALSSINESKRQADVTFTTGAAVDRTDWTGKRYREVLSMDPKHVRLDRLNSGAPLLNSHSAYSISDVIGVVEPGSARMAHGQGVATVRFSQRDDVEAIWQDVVDGIIGAISVGYRVHKLIEDTPKDGSTPTRTATDWEPFEISLVSMPADPGAKVRGGGDTNVCEIVQRSAEYDDEDDEDDERAADGVEAFDWSRVPHLYSDRACDVRRAVHEYWRAGAEAPAALLDELVHIIFKHKRSLGEL